MTAKLKYPLTVMGKTYPAGTDVEIAQLGDLLVYAGWSNIQLNELSDQIGIWLPEMAWPIIVSKKQVNLCRGPDAATMN